MQLNHQDTEHRHVFLGMTSVIASEPMHRLLELVARVARSDASVLITGESGAGKEMIARALHLYSTRANRPWVDLSCAALPEHLLESELFGHEKGAFSGAETMKPGLFELADTGTIFLDEIGELDLRMQVKLLRVLDGVPYYRLGGTRKVDVDVRVIAATNQNLEEAVARRTFRGDLFHRLNQFTIAVPALRERIDDIGPLARFFLEQQNPGLVLSDEAVEILESQRWPGNIRQLRNAVTQAAVMAQGNVIRARDIHDTVSIPGQLQSLQYSLDDEAGRMYSAPSDPISNGNGRSGRVRHLDHFESLEDMERCLIFEALEATGGHQQKAAERLGISRRTLSRKLKLYGRASDGAAEQEVLS